jgi:CDP-diacylglycerol--serine O-phosphatidyltransferase
MNSNDDNAKRIGTTLKRLLAPRLADFLSAMNLLCGVLSIVCATHLALGWCLVLLGLGALFDGLDGAAARRFGGSRFGVLADDVADGVNYGLAPATAVYYVVGGTEGLALALTFAVVVVARLLFFTWNKAASDPRYFQGTPSTIGGLLVLSGLILFPQQPVVLGFIIGFACIKMIAFSSQHRHIGRFLSVHRSVLALVPVGLASLVLVATVRGPAAAAGVVLGMSALYGAWPDVKRFFAVGAARLRTPRSVAPCAPDSGS